MIRLNLGYPHLSMVRLHNKLAGIKEVVNFYSKDNRNKRLKRSNTLTKMDEIQKKLFKIFSIKEYIIS